jgi:hypothetical protein
VMSEENSWILFRIFHIDFQCKMSKKKTFCIFHLFFTNFSVKKVEKKIVKNVWKHGFLILNFTPFFTQHFSHILHSFSKWKSRWKKVYICSHILLSFSRWKFGWMTFYIFHQHFQLKMCMNYW